MDEQIQQRNRSTLYYEPASESVENLHLMRLIDEQYLCTPFYGWPRMALPMGTDGGYARWRADSTATDS